MTTKNWTERLPSNHFTGEELVILAQCTAFRRLARKKHCPDSVLTNFAYYICRPWLPFPQCDWQQAYTLLEIYAPEPKVRTQHAQACRTWPRVRPNWQDGPDGPLDAFDREDNLEAWQDTWHDQDTRLFWRMLNIAVTLALFAAGLALLSQASQVINQIVGGAK